MNPDFLAQAALLFAEAALVITLLLAFFRLRDRFGLAPLGVTLGAFQHLQTTLAAALYVEVWPGIHVSPGSSVLFTATLIMTLLVYIRDDVVKARSLILGIVVANLTLTAVTLLVGLHLDSAAAAVIQEPLPQFLAANLSTLLIGTTLLCADIVLIIVLYEALYRVFRHSLFARIALATTGVVVFDTVGFVSANFLGDPRYADLLVAGLIGKVTAGLFYAAAVTAYLRAFPPVNLAIPAQADEYRKVFHILTYRQRYELLKDELMREPMTGLFNRRFFNDNLPREIERAVRLGHPLQVMLLDLDRFKQINDRYGHPVGDRVILLLAEALKQALRAADIPCRYGGEEFAVILPDATTEGALEAARRVRDRLAELCAVADLPVPCETVTFTAGIARHGDDADTPEDLVRIADERLYAGKRAGRNRIMFADASPDPAVAA